MRQWFISDLHLSPATPELTAGLERLIRSLPSDLDQLFILGDLFDAWVGDDHGLEPIHQIETLLATVANNNTQLYLMHGNRDFLMGTAVASRCNAQLISDPTIIDTPIGTVLCAHGDAYCTDDHAHQQFRKLSRSEQWQQQVLAMPIADRLDLAASIRHESMQSNQTKSLDIMDVNADAIAQALADANTTTMIMGHTHKPAVHRTENHTRVVLGDWHKTGWLIELTDEHAELREFDLTNPAQTLTTIAI